jgi:hypothetical protein
VPAKEEHDAASSDGDVDHYIVIIKLTDLFLIYNGNQTTIPEFFLNMQGF